MNEEQQTNKVITPLADRVLIQVGEEPTQTNSGIIIPETAREEKPQKGTVVAVGEGKRGDDGTRIPVSVSVGDTVVFSKYAPDEITIDGEEYLIVEEKNILAVVKQ